MFDKKLRALCSLKPSLAEVCRGVPISRSQLNRYLNGSLHPSLNNKLKISLYFDIPAEWFDLNYDDFIYQVQHASQSKGEKRDIYNLVNDSVRADRFSAFIGFYHEYRFITDSKILKSLVRLSRHNDTICFTNLVRFKPNVFSPLRRYRYDGYMICLMDRMHSCAFDYDSHRNAVTRFLYPPDSDHFKYLTGAQFSISPTEQRHIQSSKIVWERIDENISPKEKIKECRLIELDNPDLHKCVKRRLCDGQDDINTVIHSYAPLNE